VICLLSPQRIIVGGGVAKQPTLLALVRGQVRSLLAGYLRAPELTDPGATERYIVPPALGDCAGVIGAIELAWGAVGDGQADG
jgi:fructokinase